MPGIWPIPAGRYAVAADVNNAFYSILEHFSGQAAVAAAQNTASLTYVDLGTVGPSVSITSVGTKALVFLSSQLWNTTAADSALMSFAISGATTLAAADDNALAQTGNAGTSFAFAFGKAIEVTITPGANIFTAKYRADVGGSANFARRQMIVLAP